MADDGATLELDGKKMELTPVGATVNTELAIMPLLGVMYTEEAAVPFWVTGAEEGKALPVPMITTEVALLLLAVAIADEAIALLADGNAEEGRALEKTREDEATPLSKTEELAIALLGTAEEEAILWERPRH